MIRDYDILQFFRVSLKNISIMQREGREMTKFIRSKSRQLQTTTKTDRQRTN